MGALGVVEHGEGTHVVTEVQAELGGGVGDDGPQVAGSSPAAQVVELAATVLGVQGVQRQECAGGAGAHVDRALRPGSTSPDLLVPLQPGSGQVGVTRQGIGQRQVSRGVGSHP